MAGWKELEGRYYMQSQIRLPVTLVRGEGTRVYDEDGREYLDFVAGVASVSLGHCHEEVVAAVGDQSAVLTQTSNSFYTVPQLRLAELLCRATGLDRVFFCNSGAEAVEGSIKLARKWGKEQRSGAFEIIVAENGFHGRTLATAAASSKEGQKAPFTPLPPGFVRVPYDDVEAIKSATSQDTVAVLLEPVQGEGGVNVPADDYLRRVRDWCDRAGLLLMLDEVQTGVGRTGALYAFQMCGAQPDVLATAKGLGGGLPIGAFLARQEVALLGPGEHGCTFGGNPLCAHVAYRVLKHIIDRDIPSQVVSRGERLERGLLSLADKHPLVTEVRGKGLIWALELGLPLSGRAVRGCLEDGLLVNAVKPTALRLTPPLTVTEEEIDQAVEVMDGALVRLEADGAQRWASK